MINSVPLILNFSHVYEMQGFVSDIPHVMKDCTGMTGTNGYCDDRAAEKIRQRLEPETSVCFIDNGNYHYVSCIRAGMVSEPFDMIVFDHHTDLQPSMFGQMLSCGSWIRNTVMGDSMLKGVLLIGADQDYICEIKKDDDPGLSGRIKMVSGQELAKNGLPHEMTDGSRPVFISIDKDVLAGDECPTNWDQGSMSVEVLKELLVYIIGKRRVCGIDICGEPAADADMRDIMRSSAVNRQILACLGVIQI